MKVRQLVFAVALFCSPLALIFGRAYAGESATEERAEDAVQKVMYVQTNGLQSGSVTVRITNDGKTYDFTGYGSGMSGDVTIGSFPFTGSSCEVEVTLNGVSPIFRRFSGPAFLQFDTPEAHSTQVTWPSKPGGMDPNDTAGIVIVFY